MGLCWRFVGVLLGGMFPLVLAAKNPIIPNRGVNDPHIRIFNDTAYLYATHDKSADNMRFVMEDWWVWSSKDLVNWTLESVLKPEQTYIGAGFGSAWATDAAEREGQYYWYFSEGNSQTGVVTGPSPTGPWKDPLGKPMLEKGLTMTHEYDMGLLEEGDDHYMVFGVWDYYIAKLKKDMISLAEAPRKIQINNPRGPYGEGLTDDKPFLHKYNEKYYLSWGAFYAVSDSLYGPYDFVGEVMNENSFAPGFAEPTWPAGFLQGRHGSFFEWHNQWYFAYCDISQTGNRYFRDTFISYVHYRDNGEIAPIRVDGIGVGEYRADLGWIEAEDYFKSENMEKREQPDRGFAVEAKEKGAYLGFANIHGLDEMGSIELVFVDAEFAPFVIRRGGPEGEILATAKVTTHKDKGSVVLDLPKLSATETLYFVFSEPGSKLNRFRFISHSSQ